jgi:hypothetical protein
MKRSERQAWAEYVRQLEERKGEGKAKRPRTKQRPQPTQAENDALLDDLVREAE